MQPTANPIQVTTKPTDPLERMCRKIQPVMTLVLVIVISALSLHIASAGGGDKKGKGGGEDDIIMYNGNIVLRGGKSGGSIVMAGMNPQHEEVEFSPNFFSGYGGEGETSSFRRRRRR